MLNLNNLGYRKYTITSQFEQYDHISARAISEGEKTNTFYCTCLIDAVAIENLNLQLSNKSLISCVAIDEKGKKYDLCRGDVLWCTKRYEKKDKKVTII
tara:strand:- start:137 stop:433 length:297 start_codon:yes stop_codon:yes gene_type:complete